MKDVLIVIPARYASSRLPGKPLIRIAGIEMIKRVAMTAMYVCRQRSNCSYIVATDNDSILDFCLSNGINAVMTPETCRNGTERCIEVVKNISVKPGLIINLQGDNPLCPPWIIESIIQDWEGHRADLYTPAVKLDWDGYRFLNSRSDNESTRYSGTTVTTDKNGYALAFSKNIIPAVRNMDKAIEKGIPCPVKQHIGLYGYTYDTLMNYNDLELSPYEDSTIEGLEQYRFLYNGMKIKIVDADYRGRRVTGGVDSYPDIEKVEKILEEFGEFCLE